MTYQNATEAFVALQPAPYVVEKICRWNLKVCLSITVREDDRLLDFEDGCAIIRVVEDGLIFRISARDLVTFYGIRTLIEGSLGKLPCGSMGSIEWLPAQGVPFRAIYEHLGDRFGHNTNPVALPDQQRR